MQALQTIYEVAFQNRGKDAAAAASAAAAAQQRGGAGGPGDRASGTPGGAAVAAAAASAGGSSSLEEVGEEAAADSRSARPGGTRRALTVGSSLVQETLGVGLPKSSPSTSSLASSRGLGASGGSPGGSSSSSSSAFGGGDSSSEAPSSLAGGPGDRNSAALLDGLPAALRRVLSPFGGSATASQGRPSDLSSLTDNLSYQEEGVFGPLLSLVRRRRAWSGGRASDVGGESDAVAIVEGEDEEEEQQQDAVAGSAGRAASGSIHAAAAAAAAVVSRPSSVAFSVDTDDGGRSIVTESGYRAWREGDGGSRAGADASSAPASSL